MAVTEQVIIEFISDDSQLKGSADRLEQLGKIEKSNADQFKAANTEINKQAAALKTVAAATTQIDSTGKATKKNIQDVATAVKSMSGTFQKEFKTGVIDELKKAGVSLKTFEKETGLAFGGSEQATLSLRSQLRGMVEQLAQLKVQGKDTGQEYLDLAQKAGKLKDAIADANQQVKGFGSDTSTFDGLIQSVSGLAGGFAVVQGASALFGDESEELQKTLLRVNAAMAILQGLQQIQIVLQKESAASQLVNTVATKIQTAALGLYNFVVGSSIGLTKALKLAFAATGIGLLVLGVIALVNAFKSSNAEMVDANKLIETQKNLLEDLNNTIQQRADVEVARLQAAGAIQSEIDKANGRALVRQRESLRETNRRLAEQRDQLSATSKAWFELNTAIEGNTVELGKLDNQIDVANINLTKQLADERAEAAKKRKEDAEKFAADEKQRREAAAQREKELRAAGFADFKAGVELELLAVEKGSKEELEIRKRLLRAELQISFDNDKLTDNQRKLAVQNFFKERLELEKQFAKDRDKIILENIGADINAELQQLELSNERRLELTETAILLQAQLEVDAAEENAAKITEINAKRDKAIRDARIASIQEAVNYEIALAEASNGPGKRKLQATLENGNIELSQRIQIIDELATLENDAIQKRIDALNKEKREGLISQKDYNLQYAQLVDQQTQIWEDAEKKKTDATKAGAEKRKQQTIKDIEDVIRVASVMVDVLSSLYSLQSDKENNRIAENRQNLKDLIDAGAITEKEAIARAKKLDAEERRIKQAQAQRDKQIAVFKALLSIPQAFLEGLKQGGIILAAIYATLATVQAGLIIARPPPKFGKGKKNLYEGLAEVGETGPEFIERNGRMHLATKKTITYLGKKDKVFNPVETAAMLSQPQMNTERMAVNNTTNNSLNIDYDKIGQSVGKYVSTTVNVDGVTDQFIKKNQFEKYLDARRGF